MSQLLKIGEGFGDEIFKDLERRSYGVLSKGNAELLVIDHN